MGIGEGAVVFSCTAGQDEVSSGRGKGGRGSEVNDDDDDNDDGKGVRMSSFSGRG